MPKLTKIRAVQWPRGPTSLLYVSQSVLIHHTVIQAVKNLTDRGFDYIDIVGGDGGSLEHLLDLKVEVDPIVFFWYRGETNPRTSEIL